MAKETGGTMTAQEKIAVIEAQGRGETIEFRLNSRFHYYDQGPLTSEYYRKLSDKFENEWIKKSEYVAYFDFDFNHFEYRMAPQKKTWKIGCRTVEADREKGRLFLRGDDNISIYKSTLQEMLNEIS